MFQRCGETTLDSRSMSVDPSLTAEKGLSVMGVCLFKRVCMMLSGIGGLLFLQFRKDFG